MNKLSITWTSLGHLLIDGLVLPIHLEVLDTLGCHAVRIGVVQRERRKLLEQNLLGIVVVLDGLLLIGRRGGLIEELVDILVRVVAVVGAVTIRRSGVVELVQVVLSRRVVRLPTGAEGTLDRTVRNGVAELPRSASG